MTEEIKKALSHLRVPPSGTEQELHALILHALSDANLPVEHEVVLAPRCRIDFVVGRTGIEVKQGTPAKSALLKQAKRYLATDAIDELLLVTRDNANLPAEIEGKRVEVFGLSRLWGIALP